MSEEGRRVGFVILEAALLARVLLWGFPGGSDRKESACSMRDPGLIPGLERSPREGHGSPF